MSKGGVTMNGFGAAAPTSSYQDDDSDIEVIGETPLPSRSVTRTAVAHSPQLHGKPVSAHNFNNANSYPPPNLPHAIRPPPALVKTAGMPPAASTSAHPQSHASNGIMGSSRLTVTPHRANQGTSVNLPTSVASVNTAHPPQSQTKQPEHQAAAAAASAAPNGSSSGSKAESSATVASLATTILPGAFFTRTEAEDIVRRKGLNCFYAIKTQPSVVVSAPPQGSLPCRFFAEDDQMCCKEVFGQNVAKANMLYMNHVDSHFWKVPQVANDMRSTCRQCFMRFPNPETLDTHTDYFHSNIAGVGQRFCCHICDYSFKTQSVYLRHMFELHEVCETPYVCQICNYATSFYNMLISHFRGNHLDAELFLCRFCFCVFMDVDSFCAHMRLHLPRKNNVKCTQCRLIFPANSPDGMNLAMHAKTAHSGILKMDHNQYKNITERRASWQSGTSVVVTSAQSPRPSTQLQMAPSSIKPASLLAQSAPRVIRPPTNTIVSGDRTMPVPIRPTTAVPSTTPQRFLHLRPYRPSDPPAQKNSVQVFARAASQRAMNMPFARMPGSNNSIRLPVSFNASRPQTVSSVSSPTMPPVARRPVARTPPVPPRVIAPDPTPPKVNSAPDVMVTIKPGWSCFLKFDGGLSSKKMGKLKMWHAGLIERCIECGSFVIDFNRHYTRFTQCNHCSYHSYCQRAAINHFNQKHGNGHNQMAASDSMFEDLACEKADVPLNCQCGYETMNGAAMSRHVYFCRFGHCKTPPPDSAAGCPGEPLSVEDSITLPPTDEEKKALVHAKQSKRKGELRSIRSLGLSATPISRLGRMYLNNSKLNPSSIPNLVQQISRQSSQATANFKPIQVTTASSGSGSTSTIVLPKCKSQQVVTLTTIPQPPPPPGAAPKVSVLPPASTANGESEEYDAYFSVPADNDIDCIPTVIPEAPPQGMKGSTTAGQETPFFLSVVNSPSDIASQETTDVSNCTSGVVEAMGILPAETLQAVSNSLMADASTNTPGTTSAIGDASSVADHQGSAGDSLKFDLCGASNNESLPPPKKKPRKLLDALLGKKMASEAASDPPCSEPNVAEDSSMK